MAIAVVQQAGSNSGTSSVTSKTQAIGSATASGNLLVGTAGKRDNASWTTHPSGWTGTTDTIAAGTSRGITQDYLENCGAGAANPVWTFASQRAASHVIEFSGCATSGALDVHTTSDNAGGTTGVTGTTGAVAGAGVAVGALFTSGVITSCTSDGDHDYFPGGSGNYDLATADKLIASGTATITFSWTTSAANCGLIGVYKQAAAGGGVTVKTLAATGVG